MTPRRIHRDATFKARVASPPQEKRLSQIADASLSVFSCGGEGSAVA
jgi:hypothetical protein